MSKLVKSTKSWEEHTEALMIVRDLKSSGASDQDICKNLNISHSTLQKYKSFLSQKDIESLTSEYQNEKRCELDDQIQTVIKKLGCVERKVEEENEELVREVNVILQNSELEDQVKIKLRKFCKFPVGDFIELKKLTLQAMELRFKVWGLDKENQGSMSMETNKKVVFQINQKITTDTDKLNSIADTIINEGYSNGV